jgi:hypothetical protein
MIEEDNKLSVRERFSTKSLLKRAGNGATQNSCMYDKRTGKRQKPLNLFAHHHVSSQLHKSMANNSGVLGLIGAAMMMHQNGLMRNKYG